MRLTSIFIFICLTTATAKGSDQPNFLFFLVDDLGWADVGCNGSTFYQTTHIDSLATSGTRFTDGYAAASICSPTRASILTGRHPVRVNITDWIPGMSKTGKFEKVEDRDDEDDAAPPTNIEIQTCQVQHKLQIGQEDGPVSRRHDILR